MDFEKQTLKIYVRQMNRGHWEASSPTLKMRSGHKTRAAAIDDLVDWWIKNRGIVEARKYEDDVVVVEVDDLDEWDELHRVDDQ